MDKNKIIALVLIGVLFFGFSYFNGKEQEKYVAQKEAAEARIAEKEAAEAKAAEALKPVAEESEKSEVADAETLKAQSVAQIGESLTAAKMAQSETIKLSNEVMNIAFSTRGAQVESVELKDYTKYAADERTELVQLFAPERSGMDLKFYIRSGLNNLPINTSEYTFEAQPVVKVAGGEQLTFALKFESGAELQYIYTLYSASENEARGYMLDFKIHMKNMQPILSNQASLALDWRATTYQNERGFTNENNYTTVAYHFPAESSMEELSASTESESEEVSTKVDWISFKQQFFSTAIIAPEGGIATADLGYKTAEPTSGLIKEFSAKMTLPLSPTKDSYDLALYFGPNKYSTLCDANELGYGELKMEELVPLGWGIFGWVNKFAVIPLFDLLQGFISSFGVIILILAILVKLVISPFTYSSYISMAKMRLVKPMIDELNERYPKKEDAAKKQQATMEVYRKTGINPMGGCIPMLLQMPVVIAMFRFFPASIELRGESFLWANDLSSYDSIVTLPFEIPFYGDHVSLFALLMAVVLFFYSNINYSQTSGGQSQIAGMKFMMVYMMPVMMLLWFNSYSSGLCYYYFLANLLTIGQTLLIRRFVNDDKINAIMQANAEKKKNSKKSKFQLQYEAMIAQQEAKEKGKKK